MNWISGLFSKGREKENINRRHKDQINRLVMIAALENRLEPSDLNLLTEQVHFIRYQELPNKQQQIINYKKKLPKTTQEKFSLVFHLVTSLMRNGALSEKKEKMLVRIIQVLHLNKARATELISYTKSNIRNGLNVDASFLRLGYLLEERKYA